MFKKGFTPWNKGKTGVQPCKPETRLKLSRVMTGKRYIMSGKPRKLRGPQPVEHKEKNRRAHIGKLCSLETREKMSASHPKGELSPFWIADRSLLIKRQKRNDSAYKEWRRQVWLRDNFKCKIANPDCAGKIEAHHILRWKDFPELRYQLNNGITLCHAHHPRKRAEEKRLITTFKELVSVSKEIICHA